MVRVLFPRCFKGTNHCAGLLGFVNPQASSQYLPILGLDEELADIQQVFEGFCNTCALASPSKCAIAEQYSTPEGIKGVMNQFLELSHVDSTSSYKTPSYSFAFTYVIFPYLMAPKRWPLLGELLAQFVNGLSMAPDFLAHNVFPVNEIGYSWSDYSGVVVGFVLISCLLNTLCVRILMDNNAGAQIQ
jgi:hypothetical protein